MSDAHPIQTVEMPVGVMTFTADVCGPEHGQPVLLLHGFPQSRHAWTHQLLFLGRRGFRAVAPDLRGYSPGARPSGTGAYRLEALLDDVQGFMEMLGPTKVHLVGTDFGAQLAWFAAASMPQRIATLNILSRPHPLAHADAMANDPAQPQRSAHHRSLLAPDAAQQWRKDDLAEPRRRFSLGRVPNETAERYLSVIRPAGALEAAIEWYVAAAQRPALQDFPTLQMPVLYVCGTEDHAVGAYARERTAHYVPNDLRYVQVAGGTHYLSDMRPELVNELLIQHFSAQG